MWSAKISFDAKNLFGRCVYKCGVKLLVFPLSWSEGKTGVIVTSSGVVFGEERAKGKFFRELKRDSVNKFLGFKVGKGRIVRELEVNGDFFVAKTWESPLGKLMFNSDLVYTRPWLIDGDGKQTIVVGAFKKRYLDEFIEGFEKVMEVKVHYLRKEKISNVAFRLSCPDLTERQKWAMDLAITHGYYEIPRRTNLKELAWIGKVAFATFHGHLRKAERKIMPFLFGG